MIVVKREALGSYIGDAFHPVQEIQGEVLSRNPGDLSQETIRVGFQFSHVPKAVEAAKSAAITWRKNPVAERRAVIQRYREEMQKTQEPLAATISFETGRPLWEARREVRETLTWIDQCLEASPLVREAIEKEASRQQGSTVFRPRGVFCLISPAISAVLDSHLQWIPAVLEGNTIVFKASRYAPFVGQCLASCAHAAGIPSGVFNVIQGDEEVAQRLVGSPDVDGVFFTGSYETGLKIKKQTLSDHSKHLVLEMIGRNATVIWKDAEYERALHETLNACFLSTGQRRTTTNRVLVHESIFDKFLADFHQLAKQVSVGYPLVDGPKAPFMGPLISEAAMENYVRIQGIAVREGCTEVMRGKALERDQRGHYVSPSIHWVQSVDPKSVYQRNELLGPNVALYRVHDLTEATEVINLPQYGLVSSIYSADRTVFENFRDASRVGLIHWNRPTVAPTFGLASGGFKKSGNSHAMGAFAWWQCTVPQSSLEPIATDWAKTLPENLPRRSA